MSLLSIVQDAAAECGLPRPQTVMTNTAIEVRRLLRLADKEGKALAARNNFEWQELTKEATHTTLAAELQGEIETLAPGFRRIVNETIWDRTAQRPTPGPLSPQRWQRWKAASFAGPYPAWRIRDSKLYLLPAPTAGRTIAFEYLSRYWCRSSDGGTLRDAWAVDTDVSLLDEELTTLGVIWRFKQATGRDYAEDFRTYELRVANAMAADGGRRRLSLDGAASSVAPGVIVPEGSWLQ